jgi:hypothetical protein
MQIAAMQPTDHVWMSLPTERERQRRVHLHALAVSRYNSRRRVQRTPTPSRTSVGRYGGRMMRHDTGVILAVK